MFWAIPVGIALLAALPILVGVRRVSREAAALRREVTAVAALRAPVVSLVSDVKELREGLPELALRTRPGATPTP